MANAKKRLKRRFRKPALVVIRAPVPRNLPRAIEDPGEWGPNAVATAKLMPPPIENLLVRGVISLEQYNAAHEIERIFHWVTAGLKSRGTNLEQTRGAINGMSDPLQMAYTTRYRPWADELSGCRTLRPDIDTMARVLHSVEDDTLVRLAAVAAARKPPRRDRHHPKTLQFIIDFVVDDRTIETIAREEKHGHRVVKRALLDGLTLYAQIAGWLNRAA